MVRINAEQQLDETSCELQGSIYIGDFELLVVRSQVQSKTCDNSLYRFFQRSIRSVRNKSCSDTSEN